MNEGLTKDWVKRDGTLSFGRRLLEWDAYKGHLMDSVKSMVNNQAKSDIITLAPFQEGLHHWFNQQMLAGISHLKQHIRSCTMNGW